MPFDMLVKVLLEGEGDIGYIMKCKGIIIKPIYNNYNNNNNSINNK